MKKVLAILICALMMFTGSAMAAQQLTIENVVIYSGEQVIADLSGIELNLAIGENAEYAGVMAGLSANGQSLVEGVAAIGAEQILLGATGLSDYYSVNLQDLLAMFEAELAASGMTMEDLMGAMNTSMTMDTAALENCMNTVMTLVSTNLTDGGTYEEEGVTYQVMNLSLSQEDMAQVLDGIASVLDAYAADSLDGTGYDSFAAMFDDAGIATAMEGSIYVSETQIIADFYQSLIDTNYDEEAVIEHYFLIETMEAETEGLLETDIWYSLYSQEDDFTEPMVSLLFMIYADAEHGLQGGFAGLETLFEVGGAQAYIDIIPTETEGGKLWEVSIGEYTSGVNLSIGWGALTATQECAYLDFYAGEEMYLSLAYVTEGGAGQFEAYGMIDGEELGVVADINVTETDASWLPSGAVNSVDILDLSENYMDEANQAQMNKLATEAQTLMMNVITGLAGANSTIASMLGMNVMQNN